MFASDIWNEKPSYSDVVSISRDSLMRCQLSSSFTEATDSYNLGAPFLSHLGNESFKIDRRKIEKMIQTSSSTPGLNSADYFFNNIMKITDTSISWPMNLRIGAKTRKDPFVHIIGRPNDIAWAKGLILASLATRGPILKMKIIIAENEYSNIIGRTGSKIKGIMEKTDTHIHFPDSNRGSMTEKSNQVLIYGVFDTLERTVESLRLSTQLTMSFELPFGIPLSRQNMPDIKQMEKHFGVQIIFMLLPSKSAYFALVKGSHQIADKVKEAVTLLVSLVCGTAAAKTLSKIKLEVSKLLFDLSNGEKRINLLDLQEKTKTVISVPDPSDNRQRIAITGSVEMIYEVQQQIMAFLPIELTFDIFEKPYKTSDIMSIGVKYGISISMHHKEKDNSIAVTMRAAEKNIANILKAQEEVAEIEKNSRNEAEFPKAYFLSQPTYRKALAENLSIGSLYEEVSRKIWAPIEPNIENNFLHVKPSGDPYNRTLFHNLEENGDRIGQQEALPSTSFSPGATCSSTDSSQGGRSSGDWSVMSSLHNGNQHFECDFDSEDLEVAFIFMSSTKSHSPIFQDAPETETVCRT